MPKFFLWVVTQYRLFVSPLLPPACRFFPSCSAYAQQAIGRHGSGKGIWLSLCRLLRCHPLSPGGYDPVPPNRRVRPPRSGH